MSNGGPRAPGMSEMSTTTLRNRGVSRKGESFKKERAEHLARSQPESKHTFDKPHAAKSSGYGHAVPVRHGNLRHAPSRTGHRIGQRGK